MKHTLLALSAAFFLFAGCPGFPAVVTVTPALAQGDVLTQDGLWLPRSHRYELYDQENAVYGPVPVDTVSSYVRQGRWIYDRTAEAWVSHPSVGQPNPQFVASRRDFRDARREAWASDQEMLVQGGLWLPRSHRYELYNPENAAYGPVPVNTVSSYVSQGRWIYDRTAEVWVSHPSVGQPNPQFVASRRDFRDARREAWASDQEMLVQGGLWLPRSHRYELYNPENAAYGPVPVDTGSSYVSQGRWIYDRTAEEWVSH